MAQLTAAERLAKVKIALYGTDVVKHNDNQLNIWIDEVINDLIGGGVKEEVAKSAAAVGCIAIGVNDLWCYLSGGVKHSEYFNQRRVQLSLITDGGTVETIERHERIIVDHLTSTVAFTLEYTDGAIIRVFVNGISVARDKDYTTVANNITFTGNLIAGTEVDVFIYE